MAETGLPVMWSCLLNSNEFTRRVGTIFLRVDDGVEIAAVSLLARCNGGIAKERTGEVVSMFRFIEPPLRRDPLNFNSGSVVAIEALREAGNSILGIGRLWNSPSACDRSSS
jgi:hypothetical protein